MRRRLDMQSTSMASAMGAPADVGRMTRPAPALPLQLQPLIITRARLDVTIPATQAPTVLLTRGAVLAGWGTAPTQPVTVTPGGVVGTQEPFIPTDRVQVWASCTTPDELAATRPYDAATPLDPYGLRVAVFVRPFVGATVAKEMLLAGDGLEAGTWRPFAVSATMAYPPQCAVGVALVLTRARVNVATVTVTWDLAVTALPTTVHTVSPTAVGTSGR